MMAVQVQLCFTSVGGQVLQPLEAMSGLSERGPPHSSCKSVIDIHYAMVAAVVGPNHNMQQGPRDSEKQLIRGTSSLRR
jgi:hypothetical protein